jgi:hypothetical protein
LNESMVLFHGPGSTVFLDDFHRAVARSALLMISSPSRFPRREEKHRR